MEHEERTRHNIKQYLNNFQQLVTSSTKKRPEDHKDIGDPGYFIFQQKKDSAYADKEGIIYNWRKGIPGANQIQEGSKFIYYRTGIKVFFGTGTIGRIDPYVDTDGSIYYDGHIVDYQKWESKLPLKEIAKFLEFVPKDRLWIGQAGIRKITRKNYELILKAQIENSLHPSLARNILFGLGASANSLASEFLNDSKRFQQLDSLIWEYKLRTRYPPYLSCIPLIVFKNWIIFTNLHI